MTIPLEMAVCLGLLLSLGAVGTFALINKLDQLPTSARLGLTAVLVMALAGATWNQVVRVTNPSPVVTADVNGIVKAYIIKWSKSYDGDDKQAEADGKAFAAALTEATETLALQNKVVVVPKGTIVAGRADVPDVTNTIIEAIEAKIRKGGRNGQ